MRCHVYSNGCFASRRFWNWRYMSEADKIFEIAIRRRTLRVALASSKASIYSLQWSGDVQYCTDSIRGDWSRWRILETRISYDYAGAHWLKVGGLPTRSFRWWANKSKTWKLCIKDCSGGGEGPWWSVRWVRMCGRNCHLEKIFQERRSIPDCVSISYRSQNRVFFFWAWAMVKCRTAYCPCLICFLYPTISWAGDWSQMKKKSLALEFES